MGLPADLAELAARVRNWGRWGDDDEVGTLNLVTPEVVSRAAACVHTGRTLSLAIPLSEDGPQLGFIPGRVNPRHSMIAVNEPAPVGDDGTFRTSDDAVTMGLQCATHWDALAHVSYDGHLYNGFPATSVTEHGAQRCGIDKVGALVSRGVLLDVARARGLERLEPGHALTPDDLDAAGELARVDVAPGDVVLVRTGQMQALRAGDKMGYAVPSAGLSTMTVVWFHHRDVAAVAADNLTFEVYPGEREDVTLPVHLLHLVDMGMTQGQNFDLEALAEDCADDGRYAFLLEASPQPFVGGVGSPVNPVAVK